MKKICIGVLCDSLPFFGEKARCTSERKKNHSSETSSLRMVSFIDKLNNIPSLVFCFSAIKYFPVSLDIRIETGKKKEEKVFSYSERKIEQPIGPYKTQSFLSLLVSYFYLIHFNTTKTSSR